jgi:asparagine N-glycosylation enzyme membrane subunit Stt3
MMSLDMSRDRIEPEMAGLRLGIVFWLAVIGLFVMTNIVIEMASGAAVMNGELRGTDSYMRLLRVTQLYETGDWFDLAIPRSNAPYGESLHWTRPADLVYLAGALVLQPFFGFEQALFLWGVCVGPVLHIAMVMVLVWAVAPVFDQERRFLLILALLAQIAIWPHGLFGRTDHHMLIFLVFVATLGGAWRTLLGPPRPAVALAAGAAAGLGLWLSVEFLVVIAVLFAAFTICWVRAGGEQASRNLWHALGLTAVVALALLVERPPTDWWAEEFDRISIVHLLVGLLAVAFWAAMTVLSRPGPAGETTSRRLLLCAVGAAAAGGMMLLVFPKFFAGPEVDYDPGLQEIFLPYVNETQPLLPYNLSDTGWLLIYLGSALFAVPLLVLRLWRHRSEEVWRFWLLIALGLLAYLPLAVAMRRFTGFPAMLMAIVIADLLASVLARVRDENIVRRMLVLAVAVPTIVFAPVAAGGAFLSAGQAQLAGQAQGSRSCRMAPLIRELNRPDGLGAAPLTVLAMVNFGPRLMYDTPHRVITTPYPRNPDGQLDAFRIYKATDLEAARQLVEERRIDLIVTCVKRPMYGGLSRPEDTLDSRLRRGEVPDWLRPVAISDEASREIDIFRVHRPDG